MRGFVLLIWFSLSSLVACSGAFVSCSQKAFDAKVLQQSSLSIPLENHQTLLITKKKPDKALIAYNPFLGLALIATPTSFKFPYTFTNHPTKSIALVTANGIIKVQLLQEQEGLKSLALLGLKNKKFGLLSDECCHLEGVATANGVIEKKYLQHFIKHKNSFYADAGIRFSDNMAQITVNAVDPFFFSNPFKVGDVIVSYNAHTYKKSSQLMQAILFSKIGSLAHFTFLRHGTIHIIKLILDKRYGGGYISDTFLERKGIIVNKMLVITKITSKSLPLKLGDYLVQVNNRPVNSQQDVSILLHSDNNSLLFERQGFQFNLHMD